MDEAIGEGEGEEGENDAHALPTTYPPSNVVCLQFQDIEQLNEHVTTGESCNNQTQESNADVSGGKLPPGNHRLDVRNVDSEPILSSYESSLIAESLQYAA